MPDFRSHTDDELYDALTAARVAVSVLCFGRMLIPPAADTGGRPCY